MTHEWEKKPPVGKKFDSLHIVLEGNHTIKQKIAMFLEAKFSLEHDHNVHFAGLINLYVPLVDQWGHPLTYFPNGDEIAGTRLKVRSAYHSAADHYDRAYDRMTFPRP
jgi:hypothetical protein